MPSSSQTNVDTETDLKELDSLIQKKKLNATLARLDPDDILGTLKVVPHGVLRLLAYLLLVPDVDERVKSLPPEQRKPVSSLLKSAQKNEVEKFVKALIQEAKKDSRIESLLGIDLAASNTSKENNEAGIANTITSLNVAPLLMLKSSRLYCRVGFCQGEKLLFRSDIELAGMISLAGLLLGSVAETLAAVRKSAPGCTPNLDFDLCKNTLRGIRSKCVELTNALPVGANTESRPKTSTRKTRRKKRTR